MHNYIMKNEKDYRTAINGQGHGVVLVRKNEDSERAYGYFKTIENDMYLVSEQEEAEINTILNNGFL